MSSIGQLRRSQFEPEEYREVITFEQSYESSLDSNALAEFQDVWLSGFQIDANSSYYLQLDIAQLESTQNFRVRLVNGEDWDYTDNVQNLKSFTVPKGDDSVTVEFIFTPNSTYDHIAFELERTKYDDFQSDEPRKMIINVLHFEKVVNVLTKLNGFTKLKKVGIQGPTDLLFVLNGEEMRIGRSGIFELYHQNIPIDYIGFVLKESGDRLDKLDYFIMDYKY